MKHKYKIRFHSWVWDLQVHAAIFKMNNQQGSTYCVAQGTLLNVRWQPRREGSLGENGYMSVYDWVSLLSTWNPNIVNQLLNWIELKVSQSYPSLWDPMDYTVHGILQARILECVAFPFSRGIFPTQGSNPGLLHRRWILYQLSYQGSSTLQLKNKSKKQLHSLLKIISSN